jgi:hypothetical protein
MTKHEKAQDMPGMRVLDSLCEKVRACGKASDGTAAPVAILWTDPGRQWAPAIEMIKQALPELIELGSYAPERRCGPAIWIRCVVDRTIPMDGLSAATPPIIYMPGVARQQLRAGEDCLEEWRPLVELLYRGSVWAHPSGHDHTVSAFLKSPALLGLDVAEDEATKRALLNAVREILASNLSSLRGKRLEASDFNQMVAGDVLRDLLLWIAAPDSRRQVMTQEQWNAFSHSLKMDFTFDTEADGPLTAAERMCKGEGPWAKVWTRFEEAPEAYPGIVEALQRVDPREGGLFDGKDVALYPNANDEAESGLEAALVKLEPLSHGEAARTVIELDSKHGARRKTVWARLGRARLAKALEPLAVLAQGVKTQMGGVTPADFIPSYESTGWKTDLALLDALALVERDQDEVISKAAKKLAEPWLDAGARAFQAAVLAHPLPGAGQASNIVAEPGCCVLFVDGLRYDLGRELVKELENAGWPVSIKTRWAALPTVTGTAKPAVSPVADGIVGQPLDSTFAPWFRSSQKPVNAVGLRAEIVSKGGQVLGDGEFLTPSPTQPFGWRETGELDTLGHKLGARLASVARVELRKLADEIRLLLDAGWDRVRVVTDHGWLLLPGGLPKVDLVKHLAATKWSRCALLDGAAPDGIVTVPWHWNHQHFAATPPGIACFTLNQEYAHGGVSLQECLIPDITVGARQRSSDAVRPRMESVAWANYRCVIETKDSSPVMRVDIRVESANGPSVLKEPKSLELDGSVSIPVEDDYEKRPLMVLLLDEKGAIVAQRKTRIGEKS